MISAKEWQQSSGSGAGAVIESIDSEMDLDSYNLSGNIQINTDHRWHTIHLTGDANIGFVHNSVSATDETKAVEFTLEIYPSNYNITWPSYVIGDTSITADVINIFTVVHRPSVVGLKERTYVMNVPISNDLENPLL